MGGGIIAVRVDPLRHLGGRPVFQIQGVFDPACDQRHLVRPVVKQQQVIPIDDLRIVRMLEFRSGGSEAEIGEFIAVQATVLDGVEAVGGGSKMVLGAIQMRIKSTRRPTTRRPDDQGHSEAFEIDTEYPIFCINHAVKGKINITDVA